MRRASRMALGAALACALLAPQPAGAQSGADLPVADVDDTTADEGQVMQFGIRLSKPSQTPVTFDFETGTGVAESPQDYTGRSGTLTIPAGQVFARLGIVIRNDRLFEADENMRIELANPVGARFGDRIATGLIRNVLRAGRCANDVIGRRGTDILTGSSEGDRMIGRTDADLLIGFGGDDCLFGERGHDELLGGNGDDLIDGGTGNDRMKGGNGDDELRGGRGRNRYSGGNGRDLIFARNGITEIVNCGPGRDRAKVDSTDELRACERVSRG